jgi:asparagine synthase (glutamine-hydrolysing)
MCGICGIVSLDTSDGILPVHGVSNIWPMLEKLSHRGPQGPGVNSSGAAVFGTQRLAIRGLSDGVQPIIDKVNGIIVVCNGEIDNHAELRIWLAQRGRPVTQATDVAVLPGLYLELGESFVEKLEGVFAIALWDSRLEKLILARDRAGERPLFYRKEGKTISFATEVSALAAGNDEALVLDRAAITGYLNSGCFLSPSSPFQGISKVRPGELIVLSASAERHRRYWRWPVGNVPKQKPSLGEFDSIFREAVQRQSNVDVDFGIFLSGGLDSSLVAAVAKKVRPDRQPRCYTLRFSEHSFDEGEFAESVASMLDLDIVSVPVVPENFPAELSRLIAMTGEPLADPAWIPTAMLARRAAEDVRIVFSGEAGDELFGGYPTYLGAGLAERYEKLPGFVRSAVREMSAALPVTEKKMPLSFLLKRFVEGEGLHPYARHLLWTANISPSVMAGLSTEKYQPVDCEPRPDLLDSLQLHDLETTLAEGLLTKVDRGGMSASLEVRSPFLDRSVMEFAATLPVSDRVNGCTTKAFLKRYAQAYLPDKIIHRRKRGLSIPLASWLRGPLKDWAHEKLKADRLEQAGILPQAARNLLEQHCMRQVDHARVVWALLVLDEWLVWNMVRQCSPASLN